jgi:hypothetical protein
LRVVKKSARAEENLIVVDFIANGVKLLFYNG